MLSDLGGELAEIVDPEALFNLRDSADHRGEPFRAELLGLQPGEPLAEVGELDWRDDPAEGGNTTVSSRALTQ